MLADSLIATLPAGVAATRRRAVLARRDRHECRRCGARLPAHQQSSTRFRSGRPMRLLALAQLEFARGDRGAARRRFDMLLRDYPTGKHVARASLWSGRLALEEQRIRDRLRDTERRASPRRHGRCRAAATSSTTSSRSASGFRAGPRTLTRAAPARTGTAARPAGPEFSVQVAAYTARADATSLATIAQGARLRRARRRRQGALSCSRRSLRNTRRRHRGPRAHEGVAA